MKEVEIKKNSNGNYSVDLILWDKNGYGTAFGKYFGTSCREAKKTAKYIAELYNCKIKENK